MKKTTKTKRKTTRNRFNLTFSPPCHQRVNTFVTHARWQNSLFAFYLYNCTSIQSACC